MRQPSSLLYGPRLAQQYGRSKDCQRSCSVLHDGALHAPFLTNTLCPRLLCLYLFLSFRAMALGQVHLQGVWIEMHWSFTHWKQACSPFFFFFFFFVSNSLSSTSFHCRSMHEFSSITRPKAWICGDFKNVFLIDQMEIDLIWGLSLSHSAITHSIVFFVLFIYFLRQKEGTKW